MEAETSLLIMDSSINSYREANDQKFKTKEGDTENQLIKAMAVAVSNLVQWFKLHLLRSLPIRTVMPADAHAAANVRVDVICTIINKKRHFVNWRWTRVAMRQMNLFLVSKPWILWQSQVIIINNPTIITRNEVKTSVSIDYNNNWL